MNWIELDDRERMNRYFTSTPELELFWHPLRSVDGQTNDDSFFSATADRPGDSIADIERYAPFTIYDFMNCLSTLWRTAEFDDVLKKIVTAAALKHDPVPCQHHVIFENANNPWCMEGTGKDAHASKKSNTELLKIGVYEF